MAKPAFTIDTYEAHLAEARRNPLSAGHRFRASAAQPTASRSRVREADASSGPTKPSPWRYGGTVADRAPIDFLPADPEGLPPLKSLPLPGPRRAKENRGGATAIAVTIRILIRCPLPTPIAALFPPPAATGRPTVPARYWLFYAALARELKSFELADEELQQHWDMVRAEFAAVGVRLPVLQSWSTNKVPGYAAFNTWRKEKVIKTGLLPDLQWAFTLASLQLAGAIRAAEGRATGDPLCPSLGEILSGDATVFRPPSDVREERVQSGGREHVAYPGSRARFEDADPDPAKRTPGKIGVPRPHKQGHDYGEVKKHGVTTGQYHLALSVKGYDTYTRVVVAVDIAPEGVAESPAVTPMIHAVLTAVPGYFETLVYDGQMVPKHALEIMRRHGTVLVNHNSVKNKDGDPGPSDQAGLTDRSSGQYRDQRVNTHYASVRTLHHEAPDHTPCIHNLLSDDGAIYEADRGSDRGRPKKTSEVIVPTALHRTPEGTRGFHVDLEYTVPCPLGNLTHTVRLTDTQPDEDGSVSWISPLALHRVIPSAWVERFRAVFGARNQSEAFFSWLERCYTHKDRVASWGHEAQVLDLLGASLLHNAEAWAHYAHRHGNDQ